MTFMRVTNYTLVKCALSLRFQRYILNSELRFLVGIRIGTSNLFNSWIECLNRPPSSSSSKCSLTSLSFLFWLYSCWFDYNLFFFHAFSIACTHRYNISWTVDSHTPIEEFKLYFRRLPQGSHDIDNSIDQQQPLQHHNSQSHRNFGNLMHWSRNDWRDVVLPSVPPSHHYTQGMSYMIRGLDPDQQYEARVQARYFIFFSFFFNFSTILT